ncbi:hypothetical protein pb186bvf_019058 [Paramecium bursaria]
MICRNISASNQRIEIHITLLMYLRQIRIKLKQFLSIYLI